MRACKIKIKTHTEGEELFVQATGTFAWQNEEAVIDYLFEGDRVTLRARKDRLLMERHGDVCLSTEFSTRQQTLFLLDHGAGEIPLTTFRYRAELSDVGADITIGYCLQYPNKPQRFLLNLKAIIS